MDDIDEVRRWIRSHWDPDQTLSTWWTLLYDAGLAFPTWSAGLGGRGASPRRARAIAAALIDAEVIAPPIGNGPNMGAPTVLDHATAEQQQRFIEPLGRGQVQWCQLFSEPAAGSDLASVATRAEAHGDHLVVTGQKLWSSKADLSEWGMLLCRTDPTASKHAGLTFAMIRLDQPGVEIRPLVQMNGAADFSEVFLTEAIVDRGDVIGGCGAGWAVARTTLAHERASTADTRWRGAIVVEPGSRGGNLDRPVGELVARWRDAGGPARRQPPLMSWRAMAALARRHEAHRHPALRDALTRFVVDSEVYRLNGRRVRDLGRARAACALDGPALKLQLAALAATSRDLSLAIAGPHGTLTTTATPDGGSLVRTALSSYVPALGGGTNEIQRNVIGERTLGLPREPVVEASAARTEGGRSR